MDSNFTCQVENIRNFPLSEVKEKVRNKIRKRIEELRKNDDTFFKEFEFREKCLWSERNFTDNDETLRNLLKYYDSVLGLEYQVNIYLSNTNLKKIIFNKYYFYPPKYAFIKSLLSSSKCGLCITSKILLPCCRSNK